MSIQNWTQEFLLIFLLIESTEIKFCDSTWVMRKGRQLCCLVHTKTEKSAFFKIIFDQFGRERERDTKLPWGSWTLFYFCLLLLKHGFFCIALLHWDKHGEMSLFDGILFTNVHRRNFWMTFADIAIHFWELPSSRSTFIKAIHAMLCSHI
jgi:hypothetical protein